MENYRESVKKFLLAELVIFAVIISVLLVVPIVILFLQGVLPLIPISFSFIFNALLFKGGGKELEVWGALIFNLLLSLLLGWLFWFESPVPGGAFFSNT